MERFLWERLNMQNSYRSTIASRIVQSFGRISRGMSDHGVIVLTGQHLVDWIRLPRNRTLLPAFLQRQITAGEQISEHCQNREQFAGAANSCLSRSNGWLDFYSRNMGTDVATADSDAVDLDRAKAVALAEAEFSECLWRRDYLQAVQILKNALNDAFELSQSTGAWLSLWLGFALEMVDDPGTAHEYYVKAQTNHVNLPRSPFQNLGRTMGDLPEQIVNVQQQMRIGHPNPASVDVPKAIEHDLKPLSQEGTSSQIEEAIRCLGQYLGLRSTRPDKEFDAGPDVLWLGKDGYAVCFEVKSDKKNQSRYRKDDVGQMYNHIEWVRNNSRATTILPVFVGRVLPVSQSATPSSDMRVVELRCLKELSAKLEDTLRDVASASMPLNLGNELYGAMKSSKLLYPDLLHSLDFKILKEIPGL